MALLTRLFSSRPRRNQQQVARRAAAVIDHVIFDVGVDRFVNGTVLLDNRFRLRFLGSAAVPARGILAAVPLAELAEAQVFRRMVEEVAQGSAAMDLHTGCLVHGLMRELRARAPALAALP